MLIIWKWSWIEDHSSSDSDELSGDDGRHDAECAASVCENSSSDEDEVPPITHSVVFKCIGSMKEFRYQELLALASKKLKEGGTVPVKLQKEPTNPADSRAIAFMCQVDEQWERIWYVFREALDAVHDAMDHNTIVRIHFEWVKYIVYLKLEDGMQVLQFISKASGHQLSCSVVLKHLSSHILLYII